MPDPFDGSVALLVKTSEVWAWTKLRAAAIAKRKRKIRRMVMGGIYWNT